LVLTESIPQNHKPPLWWLFLFWSLACLIAFISLGNLPLRDFDEATVARVSLELSQKIGIDRLLPSLWDKPYLNKPPGLHWLISFAIGISQNFQTKVDSLPSEFSIRFFPALFSTFVVPLGGLIQWYLRPKDRIASIATSSVLLTLLPITRYGRMAMLDGTQLSAIALLWLCLVSVGSNRSNKHNFLVAGFSCSFMLLLKAPLVIPALLASSIPLIWEQKFKSPNHNLSWNWFIYGLIPGLSWHLWNLLSYGSGAFWLWWGDGAGRVLFAEGSGSELGILVPIIEVLEGGWPWILVWPIGFLFSSFHLNTRWGLWSFSTQLIIAISILPLKMQLPWYSHPFWLPFSLLCGPPLSWLIQREDLNNKYLKKILGIIPYVLSVIGLIIFVVYVLVKLNFFNWLEPYLNIIFFVGLGWLVGGLLLSNSRLTFRKFGFFIIVLGSLISLLLLMSSKFWLWELNENWDVRPVAEVISELPHEKVYLGNSFERPSLNWYSKKQIPRFENQKESNCVLIKKSNEWDLYTCND
tara:strand:- start:1077 stop:2648 length:1572 start_codon:yes stop_codon:yes gene_type:complete